MTIQEFIEQHKITRDYIRVQQNPAMADFEGDHYKVTLCRPGRQMSLVFSKGYGRKGAAPTTEEVLECLQSDARSAEDCASFEDFCDCFGYDIDSRKAEKIYKAVKAQAVKLRTFFNDLHEEFLACEEED